MSQRKERELQEEKDWNKIDEAVITSESFFIKNGKAILIGIGAVAVIVGLYFAYQQLYLLPKTKDAQVALFKGEQYFQAGQDSLALYGDGNGYVGFEAVINEYGSTKTGDLAKAYAGLTYARLGDYEKALSYLKDFSGGDAMITPAVKGAIGDCLVNTGKAEEAVSYFEKTAKDANDVLISPIFYKKAAIVYRDLKKYDKVIEMFTTIKNNYIASPEAADADKYIQEANLLKGAN
jgi:tetratricopeptide (TPR) repeat protein